MYRTDYFRKAQTGDKDKNFELYNFTEKTNNLHRNLKLHLIRKKRHQSNTS